MQGHFTLAANGDLTVRDDANPESKVKSTYAVDKNTVLSLQPAPSGKKDDLRLIEINTSAGKLEVLSSSTADASAWMAVLQAGRSNPVRVGGGDGRPSRRKSQSEMDQGAIDELSNRKFMEVYMKKKAKDPLGLRLAGGTGAGSDPTRPHIYVTYTRTGSIAAKTDLRKGDIITHINRRKFTDVSVQEATNIINKEKGNRVAIGVARVPSEPKKRQPHHDEGPPMDAEGGKKRTSGEYGFAGDGGAPAPGSPASAGSDEEVFGFGSGGESPVAEKPAPPPPSADEEATKKAARAEKLAKMKAARELKKQRSVVELEEALAIIDNLAED